MEFQINEKVGITFSSILRDSLRQDPDVILLVKLEMKKPQK